MADKTKQVNNSQLEALSAAINELERKAQHVNTMSQNDKNEIAGALLDAILDGLSLNSEPLLNMAVRRFKIMVEHGASTKEFMTKIKAVCMVSLRSEQRSLLREIISVYQPILLNHPELRFEGINDLGLVACLAIKSSFDGIGEECAKIILIVYRALSSEEKELTNTVLQLLRNIVTTAARARNENTFCNVLKQTTKSFSEKRINPDSELITDFYLAILFAAADHRWSKALYFVDEFMSWLLQQKLLNTAQRKKIAYEWVQLIGQIARRNWPETAQQLMVAFFVFVSKSRDREVLLQSVRMMGASIKMHAAWDGFDKAFAVYYPCQIATLILLDTAFKQSKRKNAASLELAKMLIRTMRDITIHISRLSLNRPETEVFNRWLELWADSKAPKHLHLRAQRMLQLTVLYWAQLQPKTSKNQMPHMIKIFQPNLIDEPCKLLLKE